MSKRYQEKLDLLDAATALKEHDRVPLGAAALYFPARYAGYSYEEVYYDNAKYCDAARRFAEDFDWDAVCFLRSFESIPLGLSLAATDPDMAIQAAIASVMGGGIFHDILRDNYSYQPGRELAIDNESQFIIRKPLLSDEEFEDFVDEPIGFLSDVLVGRIYDALAKPDSAETRHALLESGRHIQLTLEHAGAFTALMREADCPPWYMGLAPNPLDFVGAFIRDFDNFMMDMLERPERVVELCEKLAPIFLFVGQQTGMLSEQLTGSRRVFLPVWYNSFLGPEQFRQFHWPFLKFITEGLIDSGFTPLLSLQGSYDMHLDTLKELPAGKFIAWFDKTDPLMARERIGDDICIAGGIDPGMMIIGSEADTREATRRLVCGMKSNPGFICTLPFNAIGPVKAANIRAMTDAVREFGVL
jgi:uroporphyrinogen-III decarboxylase